MAGVQSIFRDVDGAVQDKGGNNASPGSDSATTRALVLTAPIACSRAPEYL